MQTLHLAGAAVVVQRAYRQRLARKLLRTIRSMRETRRQEEAAARLRSAIKLQAVFRGSFLRHALRDVLNDEAQAEAAPSSPSMRDRRKSRSRERRPRSELSRRGAAKAHLPHPLS